MATISPKLDETDNIVHPGSFVVVKAEYDSSIPLGPDDPFPLHVEAVLHLLGTKAIG